MFISNVIESAVLADIFEMSKYAAAPLARNGDGSVCELNDDLFTEELRCKIVAGGYIGFLNRQRHK